jgi:NhaP-type Na+/H+ or K+/H+ antiporter
LETGIAAFALLLAGYALIANRLDKLSIGPALTFVVVGLVLGPAVLDMLPVDVESSTVRHLAEITLALVLFTDASTVDLAGLRRDAGLIGRLLGVGLLLTIAAGGLVGTLMFPELPLATALLIAAILAPTDAALGLPVITNPTVPIRVRRVLNVESGLNDGIATPFVLLFISLATAAEGSDGGHFVVALAEIAIAIVVGIGIGGIGGRLLREADRLGLTSGLSRQIVVLALALGGYFASVALGGNGFVAAFVAGLAFGAVTRGAEEQAEPELQLKPAHEMMVQASPAGVYFRCRGFQLRSHRNLCVGRTTCARMLAAYKEAADSLKLPTHSLSPFTGHNRVDEKRSEVPNRKSPTAGQFFSTCQ